MQIILSCDYFLTDSPLDFLFFSFFHLATIYATSTFLFLMLVHSTACLLGVESWSPRQQVFSGFLYKLASERPTLASVARLKLEADASRVSEPRFSPAPALNVAPTGSILSGALLSVTPVDPQDRPCEATSAGTHPYGRSETCGHGSSGDSSRRCIGLLGPP